MWDGVKKSYAGVGGIFARYWRAYGGSRALFSSPYLHVSVLLAGAMYPFWLREAWWDTALSTLPNVLGFTLAGFTIWLGFGDEKFRTLISRAKPDRESPFMGVSAGFAHFVVVQILALMAASKSTRSERTTLSVAKARTPTFAIPLDACGCRLVHRSVPCLIHCGASRDPPAALWFHCGACVASL